MKLIRLELERFTAFDNAIFEFSTEVNVLIGENGTGKSHVLKLIYCLSESIRRYATGEGFDQAVRKPKLEELLSEMLAAVFQPDDLGRLVRRGKGRRKAKIRATWRERKREYFVEMELTNLGGFSILNQRLPTLERSIFIPTREVLSIFPGFIASYVRRESSFDRTIYDLCIALDAKLLRGAREGIRKQLLPLIEKVLGGNVVNNQGRFYIKLADGNMEAPLVAEGLRKLGMLDYLIGNGSLTENGFLLWDEPEAGLNPKLTRLTSQIGIELAGSGVQCWIATHDYLLTSELTLLAEEKNSKTAFFALARTSAPGTFVERGNNLAELSHNSILKAFSDLHQREEQAFFGDEK